MKKITMLCIISGVYITICAPVFAEPYLSAEQVKALFAGKTVSSYHEIKEVEIVAYYDANGEVRGIRNEKKSSGKWRIKENGEICIKRVVKERCRVIAKQDGVYRKYKLKSNDDPRLIVTFKSFKEGNVNGY